MTYIAIFVSYVQMTMTNSKINEHACCCYLSGSKIHKPGKSKAPSHDIAGENRKPTNPSNQIASTFKKQLLAIRMPQMKKELPKSRN